AAADGCLQAHMCGFRHGNVHLRLRLQLVVRGPRAELHLTGSPPTSESSATGRLDPDDVSGSEVARRLGRQLLAVHEVAPGSARVAPVGAPRAPGAPF